MRRAVLFGFVFVFLFGLVQAAAAGQRPAPTEIPGQTSAPTPPAFFEQGLRPQFASDLANFPNAPQYTYTLTLTADFDQATLAGQGSIRYTNTTPRILTDIVLHLYANLESYGGEAAISNLRVNGELVELGLDETLSVVTIALPQVLPQMESLTLDFDYSLTVLHGRERMYHQLSYLDTELALASPLPLLSVYDADLGWWRENQHVQGDAVYSEIGNFDVTLTAPSYLNVFASGSTVEETPAGDNTTYRYAAPLMRDFSIMASSEYQTIDGFVGDIDVLVHYLPQGEPAADQVLEWAMDAVQAYTSNYGDYVYPELDIVQTYTSAGGIEYPGLIVVADNVWSLEGNARELMIFEWVVVHEVAHQWWYSMVGNNQVTYPWLDEALTDYSVAIYDESAKGESAYQDKVDLFQFLYTDYESQNTAQLVGMPAAAYPEEGEYGAEVYRKGAYFFHTLRQVLGDEAFFSGLQTYFSTYRYKVATPFDLQTVLEQVSGIQLDDLFNQWIGYSN